MKSCLVVDDSKVIRKVARRILETLNFTVSEARDGQEALVACRQSPPDVVLLDWNIPVMSGMDFLRAISADPDAQRPKVVFCTRTEEHTSELQSLMRSSDAVLCVTKKNDI